MLNMIKKYYVLVFLALILSCEKDDDHDHDHDSEVFGCMDETATNYNSLATEDDGSCVYEESFDKSLTHKSKRYPTNCT